MSEIEQTQSPIKGIISSSNGLKVSGNREVPNIDNQPPLDNLHTLKHKELKELCKSKGLKVSGNKDVLLGRLRESFRNGEASKKSPLRKETTSPKKRAPRTPLQLEVVKMKSSNYRTKDRLEAAKLKITQKEVRDRRREQKRAAKEMPQINTQLEKARANDLDEEQFEPLIKALEEAGREQETIEVLKLHAQALKTAIQRNRERVQQQVQQQVQEQVQQQIQQQIQQQFEQFKQQVQQQIQHQVQHQVQQQFQQQAEQ